MQASLWNSAVDSTLWSPLCWRVCLRLARDTMERRIGSQDLSHVSPTCAFWWPGSRLRCKEMLHVNARKQTALRDKFRRTSARSLLASLTDWIWLLVLTEHFSLQSSLFTNVLIPMESRLFISLSGKSGHAKARQGSERFLKELSMLVSRDFLNEKNFLTNSDKVVRIRNEADWRKAIDRNDLHSGLYS